MLYVALVAMVRAPFSSSTAEEVVSKPHINCCHALQGAEPSSRRGAALAAGP